MARKGHYFEVTPVKPLEALVADSDLLGNFGELRQYLPAKFLRFPEKLLIFHEQPVQLKRLVGSQLFSQ
jgi:hypothetical protein